MPCEGMDIQCTHCRPKRGWGMGWHMMCLPQGGLSAGKDRLKVVICPCWGSDPASGNPGVQKPPLGRGWVEALVVGLVVQIGAL